MRFSISSACKTVQIFLDVAMGLIHDLYHLKYVTEEHKRLTQCMQISETLCGRISCLTIMLYSSTIHLILEEYTQSKTKNYKSHNTVFMDSKTLLLPYSLYVWTAFTEIILNLAAEDMVCPPACPTAWPFTL
jgi:hypothetical protein